MLVAAQPCLWTASLQHRPATRGPRNLSLRLLVAHLPGPHLLFSFLPRQVAQLVSRLRATVLRTTCPQGTMQVAMQHLPAVLQWHTWADTALTYQPIRWRFRVTASAAHRASRRQDHHLFHRRAATSVLPHQETASQTSTATASPPSAHPATQEAVSTARATPT